MPEIEPPSITVVSSYPGASPDDVEIKVTEPLENQLATTPGLEKITSRSSEGSSVVRLKFKWGTNLDEASNDIRDRIDRAKRFLPDIPDEMDNPFIFKFNTANIPIIYMGITAVQSYPELYDIIDKRVADPLKQIAGVGTVQLMGGMKRQINVWIDRERLEGYGLSILDIQNTLKQENITQPLGSIKSGLTDYLLRLPGEFSEPEEMNLVILGKRDNKFVYLNSQHLLPINKDNNPNEMITLRVPFLKENPCIFLSPEIMELNELPFSISYKTIYYSLGSLIIYFLFEKHISFYKYNKDIKDSNKDNTNNKDEKVKEIMRPIKETKLYWFLLRITKKTPDERWIYF